MNKKLWIVFLVLIICTISFTRSFLGLIGVIPWHYGYSDVFNEERINPELAKKIPYLERAVEYPVITGFFIYSMWYIGKSLIGYVVLTWIFLTLCAIITALVLYKLCKLLNIDKERLIWFFIFAPSLIVFGVYNWDMIAVMFMVLAIYFFYRNNYIISAIFLGLGFNAKLFPILILPMMLLKTNLKQDVKIILVFLVTFFILNAYYLVNSFDVWKATYLFHSLREPNIDSIWAFTGLETSTINFLSLTLFLLSYIILVYYHKKYDFLALSFMSILLFLLFNKIFSPQYILWLLPFFVLSKNITRKLFYSLEATNLIVFFSTLYWIFVSKEQIFLITSNILTTARSLILAFMVYKVITILKTAKQV